MEDQTRFGRTLTRWRGAAVTGFLAALATVVSTAACSGPQWQQVTSARPDERRPQTYCMVERETEPRARVINYVDPELCGRYVRDRSFTSVRVPPIARPSSQRAR